MAVYVVWNIWKERNRRIFENAQVSHDEVIRLIRDDLQVVGPIFIRVVSFFSAACFSLLYSCLQRYTVFPHSLMKIARAPAILVE